MSALFWKKMKEICNHRVRLIITIISPIISTIWIVMNPIEIKYLVFSLPLFNIFLFWLLLFSVEDFVYAEVVLATKIKIKDMWITSIAMISLVSLVSVLIEFFVILLIANRFNEVTIVTIIDFIMAYIIGLGLLAFSTYYISDYSNQRNIVSSVGGVINLLILGYIIINNGAIEIIYSNKILMFCVSIVLFLYSYLIVCKFSCAERFIVNIKKIGQAYDNHQSIDE